LLFGKGVRMADVGSNVGTSGRKRGVTRRSFLQAAAGTAAGSALVGAPIVVRAQEPPGATERAGIKRFASGGQNVTLQVNGKPLQASIRPDQTLLEVLREKFDLTGAKEVCDRGACGACTVLLDGRSINSCMMLALDAVDRQITTVEGLMSGDQLDPI